VLNIWRRMVYNMNKDLHRLYLAILRDGYGVTECREGSWLGEKYAGQYRIRLVTTLPEDAWYGGFYLTLRPRDNNG
jgi:hypothetical protein